MNDQINPLVTATASFIYPDAFKYASPNPFVRESVVAGMSPEQRRAHIDNLIALGAQPIIPFDPVKYGLAPIQPGLKIDLGCGPHPREGFIGCDQYEFKNDKGEEVVKHVFNIGRQVWPFSNESVGEAWSSHFVEHLNSQERCFFVNELFRVLVPRGSCTIVIPHWGSSRAYGDPTHQWPPVAEFWFYYLDRTWRMANAPHTDRQYWKAGFDCDFTVTWGYSINPEFMPKAEEVRQFAVNHYREGAMDMQATLTKK